MYKPVENRHSINVCSLTLYFYAFVIFYINFIFAILYSGFNMAKILPMTKKISCRKAYISRNYLRYEELIYQDTNLSMYSFDKLCLCSSYATQLGIGRLIKQRTWHIGSIVNEVYIGR